MEGGDSPPNANGSARPFQSKKEKSTAILLAIILIFVACHLLRFIVQIYEVFSGPLHGSHKLYQVSTTQYVNRHSFRLRLNMFPPDVSRNFFFHC